MTTFVTGTQHFGSIVVFRWSLKAPHVDAMPQELGSKRWMNWIPFSIVPTYFSVAAPSTVYIKNFPGPLQPAPMTQYQMLVLGSGEEEQEDLRCALPYRGFLPVIESNLSI